MSKPLTIKVGMCTCSNYYHNTLPNWQGHIHRLADSELARPITVNFRTFPIDHDVADVFRLIEETRCHFDMDLHYDTFEPEQYDLKIVLLDYVRCRAGQSHENLTPQAL